VQDNPKIPSTEQPEAQELKNDAPIDQESPVEMENFQPRIEDELSM
jgi:hypothetical protein